ncbi:MAG: TrbI/VirB10 family protein [Rickettsiales bacterium]|jgi:type IV secretory pathway VirB10-like protein|nr:TrbI/VirB10 family protein [Rickettsiales bacterium]
MADSKKTQGQETGAILPDDKKSASDIRTRRTNILLAIVAFIMFGTFVVGAVLVMRNKGIGGDVANLKPPSSIREVSVPSGDGVPAPGGSFDHIKPEISVNPAKLVISGVKVGGEDKNSAHVSVANAPIKVLDVSLSNEVEGLVLSDNCSDEDSIKPETGCTVSLSYSPKSPGKSEMFINIKYTDITAPGNVARDGDFRIPLELEGVPNAEDAKTQPAQAAEPKEEVPVMAAATLSPPASASGDYDDSEEADGEDEEEEDEGGDDEESAPAARASPNASSVGAAAGKAVAAGGGKGDAAAGKAGAAGGAAAKPRTVFPDDCKKYASKAYDFSGVFIGWAQGTKEVFSPNCSKLIGTLMDDGTVVESGTGRVLGRGAVMDSQKSEEARIETELPQLREIARIIDADTWNPDPEEVAENRAAAKSGDVGGPSEANSDPKIEDSLGILTKKRLSFVPFTIDDPSKISTDPKDERYVLRQSKPIPAVLTRPLFISDLNGDADHDAIATVERNVYGGDGRTIVIPTGSMLIGSSDITSAGEATQSIAKITVNWERLIRPDGAEFNLEEIGAYSADAQGRLGIAGKNDTEYMKNMFLRPLMYSALPVAMEMLFPTTSNMVTRARRTDGSYQVVDDMEGLLGADGEEDGAEGYGFDLDDEQTALTLTAKDKMKMEIQQNWKTVMQKMAQESAKQRIPFTVPAGTRIQVYLHSDVMLKIGSKDEMVTGAAEAEE